jgi:hypothetical protein
MKKAPIGLRFQGSLKLLCTTGLRGNIRGCGGFVLRPPGGSVDLFCSPIQPTESSAGWLGYSNFWGVVISVLRGTDERRKEEGRTVND